MLTRKFSDLLISVTLIACLIVLVGLAVPLDYPNHFNFDESIELIRVHLLKRGYIFYQEVWSDHPLGLPRIFDFFSNFITINLPTARRIIIFISAANLLIFYSILRLECDRVAATVATLILIASYQYIPLSGSVINEIPSITVVMLSLLLMSLYARNRETIRYIYLALSAFFFIFALEVKLSGLIALPALFTIGMFGRQQWISKFKDAGVWILTSILTFTVFSTTIFPFSYYHLIELHGGASDKFASTDPSLTLSRLIATGFKEDTVYAFLTLFIIGSLFLSKEKTKFLPPLLLLGFNLLRFYKALPVWPNYYIHLAIPAAWLIGLMLARFNLPSILKSIRLGRVDFKKLLLPSVVILAIFGQLSFNFFKILTAEQPSRYRNSALVAMNLEAKKYRPFSVEKILKNYQESHQLILTDNPYFVHKFKLDTPPETAILSRKRVVAENLDGEFILKVIQKRKPDFVLLDRFPDLFLKSKLLSDFLQEHYSEYPLKDSRSRFFIAKSSKASL